MTDIDRSLAAAAVLVESLCALLPLLIKRLITCCARYFSLQTPMYYWVTGQDVAQETEKWAALANAADSAHSSVSCATSSLVIQYTFFIEAGCLEVATKSHFQLDM